MLWKKSSPIEQTEVMGRQTKPGLFVFTVVFFVVDLLHYLSFFPIHLPNIQFQFLYCYSYCVGL